MKNKKIIIWAAVGIILISGITTYAVKKKGGKEVPVFSISEVSNYMGYDYENTIYGMITSEASQEIKYNSEQKVNEVFVSNGQSVKKGDKLMAYDQTLVDLDLQMKKLDKEGIGIEIQKLRRDISELKNTKPAPPVTDFPEEPDMTIKPGEPEIPEEPAKPDVPEEPVPAQEILDEHSLPYMGKGVSNNPFHYLVSQKGVITGRFLNKLAKEKQLFVIEVRQGDVSTGEIIKFYGQKMSEEDAVEDDQATYNLELKLIQKVEKEKDIPAYETLKKEDVEKEGWLSGKGTKENPYVFLVKDTGIVRGSFFNLMKEKEYYFRLEVREENKNDGIIVKAWEQNGKFLKELKDTDEYEVDIKIKNKEPKPEEPKPEEPKPEESKPEEPKPDEDIKEKLQSRRQNKGYRIINTATVDYIMNDYTGLSAGDIKAQIAEIESQIKDLQLDEKEAVLEIKNMEKKLENQTIVSAVDGIVTILGDPNTPSNDGSPMMVVNAEEGMYVKGEISESRLSTIAVGTKLDGTLGSNGLPFTAEITYISPYPSGDRDFYGRGNNNSMYPFTAHIDNPEGIENGSYVDLRISDEYFDNTNGLELQKAFVRYDDGKYYVMISDENNRLKKQYVDVSENSYFMKIEGGLALEDRIAFPYGKNVKEGAPVREADIDELYGGY